MYHSTVKFPQLKLYCLLAFLIFIKHAFSQEYVKLTDRSTSLSAGSTVKIPDDFTQMGNLVKVHSGSLNIQLDVNKTKDTYVFGSSSDNFSFEYKVVFELEALDAGGNIINGVFDKKTYTLVINNEQPLKVFTKDLSKYADQTTGLLKISQIRIVSWQATLVKGNSAISNSIQASIWTEVMYAHDIRPNFGSTDEANFISVSQILPVQIAGKNAIFQWDNPYPFTLYQLQILRLYNTDNSYKAEDHILADIDWDKAINMDVPISDVFDNSTSQLQLITNNKLELTLGQGTGFYAWRIRPIGNYYSGGFANSLNWGRWNYTSEGTLEIDKSSLPNSIFFFSDPEEAKNSIYSRIFTEDNKIKEVTTYANGLNEVEQTKTYLPSNNVTITAQSVTDYSGRPALNTLPIPSQGKSNTYTQQFLTSDNQVYTAKNFDGDNKTQPDLADENREMKYYKENPDVRVPDAQGVPFTQTTYYDDPLNRVKQEAGPGQMHMIKQDGKNVRYYYGVPSKTELIRLFGNQAPDEKTVSKMVKVDPNNIASVTYTTSDGKVLATCLSFYEKDNMELEPITPDPPTDINITDDVKGSMKMDWGFISSKRIILTQTTDLVINYNVKKIILEANCAKLSLNCDYTLDIIVHDVENNTIPYSFTNLKLVSQGDYWGIGDEKKITGLKPGTYIIEKRLKTGLASVDKNEIAQKLNGQIEPLIKLIGDWLDKVKCKKQVDEFQTKLKGLSDALLNQSLESFLADLAESSGEQTPEYMTTFINSVYKMPLPDNNTKYYKECYFLKLFKRNTDNKYYPITQPYSAADRADLVNIISTCCTVTLKVKWIRKFDLNQKPVLADSNSDGDLDVVNVIDADDNGTSFEFIPDFEGYAMGYFDDCPELRYDPKNPDKKSFYDYMEGWGKPGDNVPKGTFNLMVYHMLTDDYYKQTVNTVIEAAKHDGKVVVPPQEDYVDDCGIKTGEKGGNGIYTIKNLFECWQNQLTKLRSLNGCDNFVMEEGNGPIVASNTADKEKPGVTDDTFGDVIKWWMPWWTRNKIRRRINSAKNFQVDPAKKVTNPHIVKDFLDCAGYQFAKILTPYSPNPLASDQFTNTAIYKYQADAGNSDMPFKYKLNNNSVSATSYFNTNKTNTTYQKGFDYFYIPLSNWGPPEYGEDNKPRTNEDGSIRYILPNIKNPIYAFKYYEYPKEGHKDYQELEFKNNYDDPNDCYFIEDGYVKQGTNSEGIKDGIAKGPCCMTMNGLTPDYGFCYPDQSYPNLNTIYDANDIRFGHDNLTDTKWKWIVNDFTGEGRVKATYDHYYWSSGQRYNFYNQINNFLVDVDESTDGDTKDIDRSCEALEMPRSKWYKNTDERGNTYLATEEEVDGTSKEFKPATLDNNPNRPVSFVEIQLVNEINECLTSCEKRRDEFRNKINETLAKNCYDVGGCKGGGVGTPYEHVVPQDDVEKMVDAMVANCQNQCKVLNTFACWNRNSRDIQTERTIYGPTETLARLITGIGGFPPDPSFYDCKKKLNPNNDVEANYDTKYIYGNLNSDPKPEIIKYKIVDDPSTPRASRITTDMYSWYQYTMLQQAKEWDFEVNLPSKCPSLVIEAENADEKSGAVMTTRGIEKFSVGSYIKFNNVDFGNGTQSITLKLAVANANQGRTIRMVIDNGSGPQEIATFTTAGTGSSASYVITTPVNLSSHIHGIYALYLYGVGKSGDKQGDEICSIDYIQLNKAEGEGLYFDSREYTGCDDPKNAGTYLPKDKYETETNTPLDGNAPAIGSPVVSPAITIKVSVP